MKDTLSKEEAIALHAAAIERFGGMPGLRDADLLDSALAQPLATFGGQSLYSSIWDKVAALGRSLICNHAFIDGNKRLGFAAMAIVLRRHGWELDCDPDDGERAMLAVAAGQMHREELAKWLEATSIKLPPSAS
jgi:death-on-curing protein